MITVFVRHKVRDYDRWKSAYDGLAGFRKQKGVIGASVHRDGSNGVIITHRFKDMNTAREFADSQELRSATMSAGVASPPEVWFGEDVEHTPH